MHTPNRIVSKRFRQRTLELYPALGEHVRLLRFFEFLVFSTFVDNNPKQPRKVVSREALLALLQLPASTGSKKFKSLELLDECKDRIPLLKLDWSDYDHETGRARVITNDGLSSAFAEALQQEFDTFHTVPEADRVHFLTGDRVRPATTSKLHADEHQATKAVVPTTPTPRRIAEYLNALPRNAFTTKVQENIESAVHTAQALPSPAQRALELSKLHKILTQPQPFYGKSVGTNTVRLFAKNTSILALKNVVKYALVNGWRTFDLRSAQLAIVAKDWNVELLHSWLSGQENDVWRELCSVFPGIPMSTSKSVIKTAIYSACYGAQLETIQRDAQVALGVSRSAANKLLAHELFIHVLAHREHQLREIRKRRGATDCFGTRLPVGTKQQARSAMAQLSQAREMQLLLPAIEFAEQHPNDVRITLWEHDGFSVHFRRDEARNERTKRALLRAVNDGCAALGYPTTLVEK